MFLSLVRKAFPVCEIILFNLAVGQLAKLGSDFGKTLNIQATVTKELAGAVNLVLDRSAEISTALENWLPSSYSRSVVASTGDSPTMRR